MNDEVTMESDVDTREQLIAQLQSPDEETRRLAVLGLAGHPAEQVQDALFAAMGDSSWRVRKEAVDAVLAGTVSDGIMESLIGLLAAQENAGLRNSAVEALERLGTRAVPALSGHVGDSDHDVRKFVIDILGSIGNADAVPLLIHALEDLDPNVSAAAAENLGKIGDPEAVQPLVQALAKSDVWLRFTILEALGRIGRPVPMAVIAPLARENLLKKAVFDCLGAIGGDESVSILVEGLKERVRSAREAAVLALARVKARLGDGTALRSLELQLAGLAGTPYLEGLLVSLETSDRSLKESLVNILGLIGDERTAMRLLHGCRDDMLRRQCLLAFAQMGETGTKSLLRSFPTADDEERCFIAYVCGELKYEGAVPLLREGLRDGNPLLRRVSAAAAGKIGAAGLLGDLVPLLDDSTPEVREGTVESLSRLAGKAPEDVADIAGNLAGTENAEKRRFAAMLYAALDDAEKLSLLIKDEDAQVRTTAVKALADLRSAASVPHLVMALADEESDVRIAAAGALGEIGGDGVLDPLNLALKDEDPWVVCAALKSFGRMKDARAVSAIVGLLEQGTGLVAISALETLAEIGGSEAGVCVRKGLDSTDEEVVKTAIGILARDGAEWLDDNAARLLAHPHWDVRRSIIQVLADQWGARALPLLRTALETETDDLVRELITGIVDRSL
jgi:HEAT repeat protein